MDNSKEFTFNTSETDEQNFADKDSVFNTLNIEDSQDEYDQYSNA